MVDADRVERSRGPAPDRGFATGTEAMGAGGTGLTNASGEPVAGGGPDVGVESELWSGRTHLMHFAGRVFLWLTLSVGVGILVGWGSTKVTWLPAGRVFWAATGLVVILGLIILGPVLVAILGRRYRLTSQRLFIVRGIFSQVVDQTELIRVDDVRLYKSFLDRVFGLGTVAVISTDATDRETVIPGIARAEHLAEAIRGRMKAIRKKSVFVENL